MKAVVRFVLVFVGVFALLFGLQQVIRIASDWSLWLVALGVALGVEALVALSRYERASLARGRSRWLLGLRLGALAVLVWMLLEPAWMRRVVRERVQEVVVVLDNSSSMELVDPDESLSRLELAEKALAESGMIAQLEKDFRVRKVKAARSIRQQGETEDEAWKQATDLSSALASVLEQVPPDELGGVVLLSDGRHNRPARVEDPARRFGILDAPIVSIALGEAKPPRDAAILRVNAPEAIHLGDRMRVSAELKFDGYKGERAKVRLLRAGGVLDEQEIAIPQENHREEVRFARVPEAGGVGDFRIEIEDLDGERFAENNGWDFETSITDARTNVLLIDRHPRWEFRYLRNLFYGRDKSIHLQWLLLNPDRVAGQDVPRVPASAARPFGDAQATALPENEEEWRKFDVIILGDLGGDELSEEQWAIISRCVKDRAALLVMVAGPVAMPHALTAGARQLVPAEVEWGRQNYYGISKKPFRIGVASAGEGHAIVQQSQGGASDAAMWASFPEIRWRHPVKALKEGAEVLLVAQEKSFSSELSEESFQEALASLARRRQEEAEAALLVTRQTGRGKVALLLTDRTWRLREGSGDIYHHRFWGNLMRWGAGPILRAGDSSVRLGTDQLTYTPDDVVQVEARLREEDLAPVFDDELRAEVLREEKVVATIDLKAVPDSNGLHRGQAGPFRAPGLYQVRLLGGEVTRLSEEKAEAGFRVVGSHGPVELADTTLNLPLLQSLAELSGGAVKGVEDMAEIPALFLREEKGREELRETSLWSQWPVLLLLFGLLTAEWVLRRSAGLP